MKYVKFILQVLIAVVLVSAQVAPSVLAAEQVEQTVEQQQQQLAPEQQTDEQATQNVTPEQTEESNDFSEQHPNQYAVFDDESTVSVRVEGYKGQIVYDRAVRVKKGQNAIDVTTAALDAQNIVYDYQKSTDYMKSIAGQGEKDLGVGSGWMYSVNGTFPDVYGSDVTVQPGDVIEWHYINSFNVIEDLSSPEWNLTMKSGASDVSQITFNPIITMADKAIEGEDVTIHVAGKYDTLSYMYQPVEGKPQGVTIPLADVSVTVGDETFVTDAQGNVTVPSDALQLGENELYFTKDLPGKIESDDGDKVLDVYNRILRTYKTVTVEKLQQASITVTGATKTIVKTENVAISKDANALNVVKALLDAKQIPYKIVEGSYGPYVQSINGEAAGTFNGWDGWSYTVNGESPEVGLGAYTLQPDDKLVLYYGTYPTFTVTPEVTTQTATITATLVGDQFKAAAKTLTNWSSSNGVVTNVVLNDALNEATITLKIRDIEALADAPLVLTMKAAALVGKNEATITVPTAQTIEQDVVTTYTAEEVRAQTEAAFARSKAYIEANAEAVSKGISTSYSGFWKTAALVAVGIDPAKYPYVEATSPFGEASDWLKPIDKANAAVNTNAGYVLGAIQLGLDPKNLKTRNIVEDLVKQQQESGAFGQINNEAFALLALDLAGATYDQTKHLQVIAAMQDETGIFPAWGSLDSTGWALMALAPHADNEAVQAVITKAVDGLHQEYVNNGYDNANTAAALISGLASVGEDIFSEKWTDWQGRQLVQHFISDYQMETGEFLWKATDVKANGMATDQAIIALGDALNGYSSFSKQALDNVQKDVVPETPEQPEVPTTPETPEQPEQPTTPEQPVTPPTTPQTKQVYVEIQGMSSILSKQAVTLQQNATALDALTTAAKANNIDVAIRETTYGLYVEGINGLMEMQHGKTSGWMYAVNGEFPERSADQQVVNAGDTVVWTYTYEAPTTPSTPSVPTPSVPTTPSTPEPSTPVEPEQPEIPEQPETPEQPEEPTTPEVPAPSVDVPFTDIAPTNYSAPYIAKLYELGITTGTTATTFSPNANLTRAQFAVMVTRALKLEATGAPKFKDVQGKWYAQAVQALVENGIVQGISDDAFAPGNTITRQQTAVILLRVLQYAGYTEVQDASTFNDAATISPYAQQAFATLQHLGILTGNEGNANPHEQLTRQQMAKLLVLTLEAIEK